MIISWMLTEGLEHIQGFVILSCDDKIKIYYYSGLKK